MRCCSPLAGSRARALGSVGSGALADAKRRFLDAANADRRGGQHSTGVRWWVTYRWWGKGRSPVPDPRDRSWEALLEIENDLEDMAVWLAVEKPSGRAVSHESIKKYVSSVRGWYKRFYRAELGLGARHSRVADVLKGYAREVPQPPKLEREGCAPADLAVGMAASQQPRVWRAALTFGVAAIARGVEFALDSERGETFEESEHMTAKDVKFFFSDGVRHARVRMRKRKDLKILRGKQVDVVIAGGGAHFDAAEELFLWIEERRAAGVPDSAPLFCRPDGAMISVSAVRDRVRVVMAAAGRDPARYGAHSLRIGGATAALAAGVPPQTIRLMGRWSSDVYEVYCRLSVEAALNVGVAICSANVTNVQSEGGFHEEHLELLQPEVAEFGRLFPADEEEEAAAA